MDYLQRARDFKTKKRLGQNFLIDNNVIDKIVEIADLQASDTILEIGAGVGFVTENVASEVKKLYAIELDTDAADILNKLKYDNIEVLVQDILKTDLSDFLTEKTKIIANIPYYITSPIIAHLLGEVDDINHVNRNLISEIYLMVQWEVALRIIATPESPNKQYGLLSVLTNFWATPELIQKVPARAFYPSPKVDSALIKLTVNDNPRVNLEHPKLFRKVVKGAFAQRRKIFVNSLSQSGFDKNKVNETIKQMGISPEIRGEKLSIEQFNDFTNIYAKL
ncbi:MAG: 16S rRNA (adenine(1518)-N(6)/adenine(1519)-N(6))-dimethyltransferase RsmA [bacterium]